MKRFGALRFISSLLRALAWVALICGLLGGVVAILLAVIGGNIHLPSMPRAGFDVPPVLGSIAVGLMLGLGALISFVILLAEADAISLALAIEENTRATAELLKGEAQLSGAPPPWESPV